MRRIAAVLFWSIIAAAFIGPGTVTTAAAAGAGYGYRLLWALLFSTFACLVLQEAGARLTVVSGMSLGHALRHQYPAGWKGAAILVLVLGAIVVGCAAYEAGNILGGVAGAQLALDLDGRLLALLCVAAAVALLWFNSPRGVAVALSLLVAVMGFAFLCTAWLLGPSPSALAGGALLPRLPPGSGLLVVGLIGTTVVPYNIFLGSGIAGGQRLPEIRFGLAVAVGLGGLISMAVVVAGSQIAGPFSLQGVGEVLGDRLGPWGRVLFAAGLFSAGLSSAVTAPLAAAVTARSLFEQPHSKERWSDRSWRYRLVWMGVVLVGFGFGLSGVRPVPAIILAQALNGVLLPVAALFLLLAVNDRALMGRQGLNGLWSNLWMVLVVTATVLLGAAALFQALFRGLGLAAPSLRFQLALAAASVAAMAAPLGLALRRRRAGGPPDGSEVLPGKEG